MKALLLLAALAAAGPAQDTPMLSLDLSGEWRMQPSDRPAFAQPEFDDTSWPTLRLPLERLPFNQNPFAVPSGWVWMRRTVLLPAWTTQTPPRPLALSLGNFASVYEVYVNGVRMVRVGSDREAEAWLSRARTHPLGAVPGRRIVLAIRAWYSTNVQPPALQVQGIPDQGPYRITDEGNAPRDLEELSQLRRLRYTALLIAFAAMKLVLALLLLRCAFFAGARGAGRGALLWLAAFLVAEAGQLIWIFLTIMGDWPQLVTLFAGNLLGLSAYFATLFVQVYLGREADWRTHCVAALPLGLQLAFNVLGQPFSFMWPVGAMGILQLFMAGRALQDALAAARDGRRMRAGQSLAVVALMLFLFQEVPTPWHFFPEGFLFYGMWVPFLNSGIVLAAIVVTSTLIRDLGAAGERLSGEMEAARAVQRMLLPREAPAISPYSVDAIYQPAAEVGGDFYYVDDRADGSRLVVVGDVSGKGLKAAMLVSVAIGILRNEKSPSPAAVLAALNDGLAGHTGGGFVTCCCARFHPDGAVTLANAGHPAPYVDGREAPVEAGLPLGVAPGITYAESRERGERFTFVSDGVVEAANAQGDLFGFDRTREISTKPASEIAEAAKQWGQNDDITVVTVRRAGA